MFNRFVNCWVVTERKILQVSKLIYFCFMVITFNIELSYSPVKTICDPALREFQSQLIFISNGVLNQYIF